jgi:hypothetical protein
MLHSNRDEVEGHLAWDEYGITGWGSPGDRTHAFLEENTSSNKFDAPPSTCSCWIIQLFSKIGDILSKMFYSSCCASSRQNVDRLRNGGELGFLDKI